MQGDTGEASMRTLLILCFLVLAATPSLAHGDEPIEALQKGVDEGLRLLQGPRSNDQDSKEIEQQKLRLILEQLFDFHEFSKRVLAANWNNFTPAQRATFVELFTEFLGKFYMSRLQEKYKDENLSMRARNINLLHGPGLISGWSGRSKKYRLRFQ